MSFCQAKHLQRRQTLAIATWSVLMQSGHFGDVSKASWSHLSPVPTYKYKYNTRRVVWSALDGAKLILILFLAKL